MNDEANTAQGKDVITTGKVTTRGLEMATETAIGMATEMAMGTTMPETEMAMEMETTMEETIGTTTVTVANDTVEATINSRGPTNKGDSKVRTSVLGTNDPVVKPTFKKTIGTPIRVQRVITTTRSTNWIRHRRNRRRN